MDSDSLKSEGFHRWVAFNPTNRDEFPKEIGVYVIRFKKKVPRLKGKSDIAKIGGNTKGGNLWKRMWDYLNPKRNVNGPKRGTARRIRRAMKSGYKFEVAYKKVSDKKEAKDIQNELLRKYENDHHELPPLNAVRN